MQVTQIKKEKGKPLLWVLPIEKKPHKKMGGGEAITVVCAEIIRHWVFQKGGEK